MSYGVANNRFAMQLASPFWSHKLMQQQNVLYLDALEYILAPSLWVTTSMSSGSTRQLGEKHVNARMLASGLDPEW